MSPLWRHDWQRRPGTVSVAASFLPSDRAGGASGDWHDVIALPSGDVAVAVGDAAGRGVQASPLKDALQGGLRRMALTGAPPLELLAHLREVISCLQELARLGLTTPGFVLYLRAKLGLYNLFHQMGARVNCHKVLERYV